MTGVVERLLRDSKIFVVLVRILVVYLRESVGAVLFTRGALGKGRLSVNECL